MSTTPHFFVPTHWISPDAKSVPLPPDAARHAVQVLRMRVGEAVILHDGDNRAYDCVLESVLLKSAAVRVIGTRTLHTEPQTRITVAQALPKTTDKIEQVLQHGTEIGAAGFVLFTGSRSVARLAENEKIEKRLERWRGIVQSSAEQSERGLLPRVEWRPFARDVVGEFAEYDAVFLAHESASRPLRAALTDVPDAASMLILIGPEGGFTSEEADLFIGAGAVSVSLGARILRTETAALVMLAQILFAREPDAVVS